jgi:hypothetical protein
MHCIKLFTLFVLAPITPKFFLLVIILRITELTVVLVFLSSDEGKGDIYLAGSLRRR